MADELELLRADADRYRFLRDHWGQLVTSTDWVGDKRIVESMWISPNLTFVDPDSVTEAVDILMREKCCPVRLP